MEHVASMIDVKRLKSISGPLEQYNAFIEAANVRLHEMVSEQHDWFQQSNYTISELAKRLSCDKGRLFRSLNSKNQTQRFSLPVHSHATYAHEIYHVSCHELYFGENTYSRIPKTVSTCVWFFLRLNESERLKQMNFCRTLWRTESSWRNAEIEKDREDLTRARERVYARCRTIMEDKFITAAHLFGPCRPPQLRPFTLKVQSGKPDRFRITTLMMLAFANDTSMDYFLTRNYLNFTSPVLFWDTEPLTDLLGVDFIHRYLDLSEESQKSVERAILMSYIQGEQTTAIPGG